MLTLGLSLDFGYCATEHEELIVGVGNRAGSEDRGRRNMSRIFVDHELEDRLL